MPVALIVGRLGLGSLAESTRKTEAAVEVVNHLLTAWRCTHKDLESIL